MSTDPHDLIPAPINDCVDAFVQRWVAGTNGRLYTSLINKLPRYPIGRWPGRPPLAKGTLLLDIGCGWGRWMVASGQLGYCPVGIDIKVDALQAAQRVMKYHGIKAYVVAADLRCLPFRSGTFDQVYSYSVIQHVHREYARECVGECSRVLKPEGIALLEFPVSHGLTNFRYGRRTEENDYDSWCVRYYSFTELKGLFQNTFDKWHLDVDCYFGIGVRPEDADLLPWPYKGVVFLSETLKFFARILPPLRYFSDSVFVHAEKRPGHATGLILPDTTAQGNLAIVPLLQCPITQSPLEYDQTNSRLISRSAGKAYPIVGDVPVMIPSEAVSV